MRSRLKRPVSKILSYQSYDAKTDLIQVSVAPVYLDKESSPEKSEYMWLYHVMIDNHRDESIKIVGTYWQLTDCYGRSEEIRGFSIGGEQPTIQSGQDYHYVNAISLTTPSGIMSGVYHVTDKSDNAYEVRIPTVSLDSPFLNKTLH